MISIYFTDEIEVVTITRDINGIETKTTETGAARVEDFGQLVTSRDGQEVMGDMLIITEMSIGYHDKVKIKKKAGAEFNQPDKLFLPKKITKWNMYSTQQTEVII